MSGTLKNPLTKTRSIVVITLALILTLGYVAGVIYINSPSFRHHLLQQLNTAIEGRLFIERHRLTPHAARLELSGVTLTDANGNPLASINRFRIELFWPALLWRTIHIKTINIEKAEFDWRYDRSDRLQIIKPTHPSSDQKNDHDTAWALRVDDCRLNQATLRYQRPQKKWSAMIDGITISARLNSIQPDGHIRLSTKSGVWRTQDAVHTMPAMKLSATLDGVRRFNIQAKTGQSKLKASGHLEKLGTTPQIDMICDLNIDPETFQTFLPDDKHLKGHINARIAAHGHLVNPDGTLKLQWTDAQAMGTAIGDLKADLRWHEHKLFFDALSGRGGWGAVNLTGKMDLQQVFNKKGNFTTAQWHHLTYDLKLKGTNLQPSHLGLSNIPADSTFQLQAGVTGSGLTGARAQSQARIDLKAVLPRRKEKKPDLTGHLTAKIQRNGPTIDLSRLTAAIGDNDLKASARMNISKAQIEWAQAKFQSGRLEELGALLGTELPSGIAAVQMQCQGPFQHPTARMKVLAEDLLMKQHPIGRIAATAQLDDKGTLHIHRLALKNQDSVVEGSGQFSLFNPDGSRQSDPSIHLNLAFQQVRPTNFGWSTLLGSQFNGHINLGGSLQHPKGSVTLRDSIVRQADATGRINADLLWNDKRLTISELNLFNKQSSIRLKGSANWHSAGENRWLSNPRIQGQIEGKDVKLQDFFPDYTGNMDLRAEISGRSSDLTGRFQVSGTSLHIAGQPFKNMNISGRLSNNKLHWDTMEIVLEKGQQLTSQGWYAFNRHFKLNMTAADIQLSRITVLQRAYPVEGRLNLRLNAAGHLDNPQMEAALLIAEPRLNDHPWEDFHIKANIAQKRLKLRANLNFHLRSEYQLDNGDFNFQANFSKSDLSPYLAVWAGPEWAGVLTGHLKANGNRYQLNQIQSTLALKNTELRYRNHPMIKIKQLNAHLANGFLELPATRLAFLKNGYINLKATGHWSTDLRIDSDGRVPITALSPLVSILNTPQGQLAFEASVRGPLKTPELNAKLDFMETGFEIPGVAQQIENLNGRLEITPKQIVAKNLSGQIEDGRFTLDGQMALKKWRPYGGELNFTARALPLQWPDAMDVVVNCNLNLSNITETPALTGRLVLLEGSYYKNIKLNLLSALTQTKRAVPVPSTYSVPDPMGKTTLNVEVTHRHPMLVNNNLADLQVAPDLKISGTLAQPVLSGRAQVVEGEVIFRQKPFTVKRGVVDFVNPYKIEPNLDIVAEAEIRQWQITLSLSGPPDQLVFKLDSTPAASESDILSLILLSRTGSELAEGEGSGQTTRQMLASLVATAWGEDVKKHAGVDILEVDTAEDEDQEDADRVQVTVGKKLGRRLTVKYEVESGSEELIQRAISEYQFYEYLLANGFQDSKGEYGGELVFRMEF